MDTPLEIELRPVTQDDSTFVYETKRDALGLYVKYVWGWDEVYQQQYHKQQFQPEKMSVIKVDGRDVGYLTVGREKDHIMLESIHILPDYQNKGIGTEIIRRLIEEACTCSKPLRLAVLKVNPAVHLYQRLGMVIASATDTHYLMEYWG
jgi:ribosomal protein S18 acetylase RimI-like enzyme